ncbi:MAG: C/D box methylation guide ribonucleoprotein complex aNOP56 subunit [Candidatus Bathyarchaeia archaeon]
MKATVVPAFFGILAFNEGNMLVTHALFSKKPEAAAKNHLEIESGRIVKELSELIEHLKESGYTTFVFENESLAAAVKNRFGVNVEVSKFSEAGSILRANMERFAVETGFAKDYEESRLWMHKVAMETAKLKVKRAVEKKDILIAQAIQALDDLDKTVNLFMSRLREWYGIHFPELDRIIDKHETYARLVIKLGNRENFTVALLEQEGIPKNKAEQIASAASKSMGADLADADLTQIQALGRNILDLYELRQSLESYIENAMEEAAPNIKAITGALLGARLIALAGGLANLAKMPASTIQVLGAEKALFRSLKTGTRPPKHGIIFQHPYLHDAKKWQRGKIARALAGKLAIAARTDTFGGRYIGDELKADLEKRIEEIGEKYAEPPKVPERKPGRKERRSRRYAR